MASSPQSTSYPWPHARALSDAALALLPKVPHRAAGDRPRLRGIVRAESPVRRPRGLRRQPDSARAGLAGWPALGDRIRPDRPVPSRILRPRPRPVRVLLDEHRPAQRALDRLGGHGSGSRADPVEEERPRRARRRDLLQPYREVIGHGLAWLERNAAAIWPEVEFSYLDIALLCMWDHLRYNRLHDETASWRWIEARALRHASRESVAVTAPERMQALQWELYPSQRPGA